MSAQRIARRYAKGLFSLEQGDMAKAKSHAQMLGVVKALFAERDAGKVLRSPVMPTELKRDLLNYALKQANADTMLTNVVNTVLESGRVDVIPELADTFQLLIDEAEGVVKADVASAVPLTDADLKAIGDNIGRVLKKRVEIQPTVDPSLLGGFVARVGHFRVDMSLKTKLDELSQAAARDSLR